jgi:hypothetical protein
MQRNNSRTETTRKEQWFDGTLYEEARQNAALVGLRIEDVQRRSDVIPEVKRASPEDVGRPMDFVGGGVWGTRKFCLIIYASRSPPGEYSWNRIGVELPIVRTCISPRWAI